MLLDPDFEGMPPEQVPGLGNSSIDPFHPQIHLDIDTDPDIHIDTDIYTDKDTHTHTDIDIDRIDILILHNKYRNVILMLLLN